MRFSLILPFRERIDMLKNMLDSIKNTANDLSTIEILIACDFDDEICANNVNNIIKEYGSLKISFYVRERSVHFTKDYINWLAKKAKGRWIITINDDSDFQNKGWDDEIYKCMSDRASEYGDDILLGLTRDEIPRKGENEKYPHFSCFPVVGKQFVDVMGYLQDERCYVWGPDHVIADFFRMLNKNRIVSLTHITIGHISTHTGRRDVNENYKYFQDIDHKYRVAIGEFDHKPELDRLREWINNNERPR